ncbi:MAG TPA: right-handed parallel beta-helix repeat-containing protein [bacterium]|nr:right-handed parallel beta-helix repeat-containing protein [bacterium]
MCLVVLLGLAAFAAAAPPLAARQPSAGPGGVVLHVANRQTDASDSNPGTERLPLKTVGRAVEIAAAKNAAGVATTVVIHPGIYRESVAIRAKSAAPVTFQAAEDGTVILSGSDVWSGWQLWRAGVYRHPWPFRWGAAAIPAHWPAIQEIVRRREMIFVDGRLLTQVLAQSTMAEATFCIDERAGWVYIWPTAGTDMAKSMVEVAVRPNILKASGATLTMRGLTFQHAATFLDDNAVDVSGGSHILIEDTEYLWNNWGGLDIEDSTDVTVRRSVANYNGGRGISDWRNKNLLFEDNETSFNNWRGAWGGFFDWAMGGIKNMRAHGGIWRRHKSFGNQAYGLWFDWDNQDVVVEDSTLCDNRLPGVFLEASQGPITVVRSTLCNNEYGGVFGNGAERVTLRNNVFYHNGVSQIEAGGSQVRGGVDDWETKQARDLRDQHWTLCGNVAVSRTPDAHEPGWALTVPDWPWFLTTLKSFGNTWWNSKRSAIFRFAGSRDLDLVAWQRLTRQDADSIFADPRLSGPDGAGLAPGAGSPWRPC